MQRPLPAARRGPKRLPAATQLQGRRNGPREQGRAASHAGKTPPSCPAILPERYIAYYFLLLFMKTVIFIQFSDKVLARVVSSVMRQGPPAGAAPQVMSPVAGTSFRRLVLTAPILPSVASISMR